MYASSVLASEGTEQPKVVAKDGQKAVDALWRCLEPAESGGILTVVQVRVPRLSLCNHHHPRFRSPHFLCYHSELDYNNTDCRWTTVTTTRSRGRQAARPPRRRANARGCRDR